MRLLCVAVYHALSQLCLFGQNGDCGQGFYLHDVSLFRPINNICMCVRVHVVQMRVCAVCFNMLITVVGISYINNHS